MNTNSTNINEKIKLIAYYLPQFHEIKENTDYWGKGFTEWTTTANAKPLFKNHYQPHVPADLGFYNLLMPETRKAQAEMAKEYGVDGFCYWHYWFGDGKRVMERPFNEVVESKEPDFPFCLCWANHSWYNPLTKEFILEQKYLGESDNEKHFYSLLAAFKDTRYIKIDGKPIFSIFAPKLHPDIDQFIAQWNNLARKEGFPGFYFIGLIQETNNLDTFRKYHFDAINVIRLKDYIYHQNWIIEYIKSKLGFLHTYKYSDAAKYFISEQDLDERIIPTIIPGWDHSPRSGKDGLILTDYTPESFKKHLEMAFDILSKKKNKLCFIKAWNEWSEGNHLEPDLKYGLKFLEALKETKEKYR